MECVQSHVETFGNGFLFTITRSTDTSSVVYRAVRMGNVLLDPVVEMFRSCTVDPTKRSELPETMKTLFFGVQTQQVSHAIYNCVLNALPDYVIRMHLKKDGRVVPFIDIDNQCDLQLVKLHVTVVKTLVGIPDVRSVEIVAYDKKSKKQVSKIIDVTEDMRKTINVPSLF